MINHKMSGLSKGIVIDTEDPAGFHRIRVRIPEIHGAVNPDVYALMGTQAQQSSWVDDKNIPWAEVCFPYGTDTLPEVNQVVLVGFFNSDPSQPVVLGWLGYEYTYDEDIYQIKEISL